MRTIALLLFALLLSGMMLGGVLSSEANAGAWLSMSALSGDLDRGASGLVVTAKSKCITIGDKRICLEDDNAKNNDDDDEDDEKPKKKKTGNKCEDEHSCPAGYVVLDKPNKYGACCEPKEGLPPAPAPEAEKCKLGMVGTPPNCECPPGSKFFGLKGCLHFKYCDGWPSKELAAQQQKDWLPKCTGIPDCQAVQKPDVVFECCCY